MKFAFDVSLTDVFVRHVTRMRACVLRQADWTTKVWLPSFAVEDLSTIEYEAPPFVDSSILTLLDVGRLPDQSTVTVVPTVQVSPPFGLVTVSVGVAIVKFTSLVSVTVAFAVQVARIRAVVVGDPLTVQLKLPPVALEFWTDAARRLHVAPPSRLSSSPTVAALPRLLVHVIA